MGTMASIEKSLLTNVEDMFTHAKSVVNKSLYDLNREHYAGFMWVACMDWISCQVCSGLDGKIFPALPGEPGGPPEIPIHPHDRCFLVPVLKGMEEDYKAVNFKDWLTRQPEKRQIDYLGPSKYLLYRKGLPVERFVKDGRTLTLEELGADRVPRKFIEWIDFDSPKLKLKDDAPEEVKKKFTEWKKKNFSRMAEL